MKLNDIKTKTKIMFLVVFSIVIAVLLGYSGRYLLNYSTNEFENQKKTNIMPIVWLGTVQSNVAAVQANMLEGTSSTNKEQAQILIDLNKKHEANLLEALNLYKQVESSSIEGKELRVRAEQAFAVYEQHKNKARELARKAFTPEDQAEFYAYFRSDFSPAYRTFVQILDELIKIEMMESESEQAAFNTEVNGYILYFGIMIGIAAIILAALGYLIVSSITRVLNEVTDMALLMGKNDLTHNLSQALLERKDEFGSMGRALSDMQQNLRKAMHNIGAVAENISASSEQLNANADQTAGASSEVANATTSIMASAETSSRNLEKTFDLIKNTELALNDMSHGANQVASTAVETTRTSIEGKDSVDVAVISINSIGDGTQKMTNAIMDLKESSAKISEIVGLITSIASQTNLLALNAAIEAARAGEHGRGFAVVAEEVRKLAEESGNAAEQIGDLIKKNTVSIDYTVGLMSEQSVVVSEGVEKVSFSGQSFAKIAQMVDELTNQIQHISAGVQQSAAAVSQIVDTNRSAVTSAEKISEEVTTVSAAAQEQAASTEEIASSSQVLAKMAEELSQISGSFKF